MNWRPIETAPKDGTIILVSDGKRVLIAWWQPTQYLDYRSDKVVTRPVWTVSEGESAVDAHVLVDGQEPTHWMPLPAPPHKDTPQKGIDPMPDTQEGGGYPLPDKGYPLDG